MLIYVFDIEVFKFDWLIIFKNISTGEYTAIHNDNSAVKEFMTEDKLLAGFNNKHYDNHILKAILCGADNALVKEINDFIISGRQGFEHWFIKENKAWFDSFDIRDDMQQGLSLKAIEGHLGLSVEETSVPFDINRPLTNTELQEVIKYCKHDVDTTERLVKIRKPYLDGKIALGRLKDIPDVKSLYATNAKITAMFLGAEPTERYDEREYVYPPNLKKELIPPEVIAFFDQIRDESIPDDVLFKTKKKIMVGGCEFVYGWGGVHGGLPTYQEETTDKRVIVNFDVASLYPSLMIRCGYTSRNIPSAAFYEKVYHDRLKAKKEGDKKTANTLKLCLNTTYGAMLNKYNPLYDPLMGRSVCISGQLFLTELVMAYLRDCKTIKIINFNTDGVMFSIDEEEMPKIYAINEEWQNRTGFELEEDKIQKIVQKDVNNYIMVPIGELYDKDGKPRWKVKGSYLTYGMSKVGAWNINNNAVIVKKALAEYFVKGIPVEKTINECNDIFEFQFIAKAGTKYKEAYHFVNDEKIPVQKVNRVYASKNPIYGKLHKVKASDDSEAKIESLPNHCIIDNDNRLSIEDVDKQFYIDMAHKRINDFLGIKPIKEKKVRKKFMATKKTTETPTSEGMTFLQKLKVLQDLMGEYAWEKDGINRHQSYKYISEKQYKANFKAALKKAGLIWKMETLNHEFIPGVSDKMHLVMCNFKGQLIDPETGEREEYLFSGSGADNGDKALYKAITGGHKFFLAANFNVAEDNDPENDADEEPKSNYTPPEKREEIKEGLLDKDGAATKMQINSLKKALKLLRAADPSQEEFIAAIAEKTEKFTNIKKKACETLILKVGEMTEAAKNGERKD